MQNHKFKVPRIGIDLGGTKIEIIVLDGDGSISHRMRCQTPRGDYQATLNALDTLVRDMTSIASLPDELPVGIGTPGAVSLKTGLMMNCNSTCLNGQPLTQDLSALINRPVRIANDADCMTLSEASDGAARGRQSVFGVILGTGVGGGIVIDGKLQRGINAISGEWGHNYLALDALDIEWENVSRRPCFCGRFNCVETWLSGPGLEQSYGFLTGRQITAIEIYEKATSGEEEARRVLEEHAHLTAFALANVINILDPQAIVLGGGLSNMAHFYTVLPDLLTRYVFSDVLNTEIVQAEYGDSSGVRGAAWLWHPDEVAAMI